jgi:hypothetical protein
MKFTIPVLRWEVAAPGKNLYDVWIHSRTHIHIDLANSLPSCSLLLQLFLNFPWSQLAQDLTDIPVYPHPATPEWLSKEPLDAGHCHSACADGHRLCRLAFFLGG